MVRYMFGIPVKFNTISTEFVCTIPGRFAALRRTKQSGNTHAEAVSGSHAKQKEYLNSKVLIAPATNENLIIRG